MTIKNKKIEKLWLHLNHPSVNFIMRSCHKMTNKGMHVFQQFADD